MPSWPRCTTPSRPRCRPCARSSWRPTSAIAEGIKWNAPSYRTKEYFLTTHLRAKGGVGLIFHLGAKVREQQYITVEDPAGLLHWLARDRAVALFTGLPDIAARRPALEALLRQWIAYV